MRRLLAWGGVLLLPVAAPVAAEPAGKWRIGDPPALGSTLPARLPFAGVELTPDSRVGLGLWDAGPKLRRTPGIAERLGEPKRRKAPGVGLKLAF